MRCAPLLAALALPCAALAQASNVFSRAGGYPAGLATPGTGVAWAEEPAAVVVNPAAAGFNEGVTLQYFHERATQFSTGDGLFLGLGPLHVGSEWVRPQASAHYRKLGLGLGLGGRAGALGVSWNDWSSPDGAIAGLRTWDLGLTVRPTRWLSVGAAVLDLDGRLGSAMLPVRYQLGVATRQLADALTVHADWLADDDRRGTLRSRAVALGAGYESRLGLALGAQLQVPTQRDLPGIRGSAVFLLSLAVNTPRAGLVVGTGGTGRRSEGTTVLGLRTSTRDYRGFPLPPRPVRVDLRAELDPPRSLPFLSGPRDPLGALLGKLRALRGDPQVGAVVLKLDGLSLGAAEADDLRQAVLELRERKPVVAWLEGGGLRELYVASAASRVELAPVGTLLLTGVSSTGLYLQEALAKVGVAFQVISIGKYKSAGEPLSRSDMSAEDREARESMLDDVFGRQVRAIAEARKLPEPRVRELVDQGVFFGEEARQAGLVDGVAYLDEVEQRLRARGGLWRGWTEPRPRLAQRWGPRPVVAVIPVAGMIVPGRARPGPLASASSGADTVADLVRQAAEDGSVKAIVLRVDSPGGDALASDLIWRSLQQARRKGKPVVVSMGNLAASGGYWISTASDAIVAEPSTITGSIGVVGLKPDLSGLLDRIGVRAVTLKRGARADLFSPTRPWTADEKAALEKELAAAYRVFLERVAEGRKLTREQADQVGQGRPYTGQQALERKLVDRLGSLRDAVALARQRAGIAADEAAEVRRLERPRSMLERLDLGGASADDGGLAGLLARSPELQAVAALLELGPVAALPPGWMARVAGGPTPEGQAR